MPVPLSPRNSSTASDAAARAADWRNLRNSGLLRLEKSRLAALVQLLLEFHQPAPQSLGIDDATGSQSNLVRCERLRDVVDCAAPDGVDRTLD